MIYAAYSEILCNFFLDEWNNFLERINCKNEVEVLENEDTVLQLRYWVSLRGQTLSRTGTLKVVLAMKVLHFFLLILMDFAAVRGMMYYRRALMLQAFLDMAKEKGESQIPFGVHVFPTYNLLQQACHSPTALSSLGICLLK